MEWTRRIRRLEYSLLRFLYIAFTCVVAGHGEHVIVRKEVVEYCKYRLPIFRLVSGSNILDF